MKPALARLNDQVGELGKVSADEIKTALVLLTLIPALILLGGDYGLGTVAIAFRQLFLVVVFWVTRNKNETKAVSILKEKKKGLRDWKRKSWRKKNFRPVPFLLLAFCFRFFGFACRVPLAPLQVLSSSSSSSSYFCKISFMIFFEDTFFHMEMF